MSLRFGVALPQVYGSGIVRSSECVAVARLAEDLGFDSVWTQEDVLGKSGTLDPLTVLAHVAAVTARVDLGVAVLLAPVMDPVQLAKTTMTLDQLSGGRLVLGLGLGANVDEYPAHGTSSIGRARRFDYVVDALRALWSGSRVTLPGSPFDLTHATMTPGPVQRGGPRLWFGGSATPALERAVRWGDGFVGGGATSMESYLETLRRLNGIAASRSHPMGAAKRVYLACTDHHMQARRRLVRWLTEYYGDADLAESVAVTGDVGQIVTELVRLAEAGTNEVILNFVFEEEQAIEAAAHEILPPVRHRLLGDVPSSPG